jgi:hypothetical protein
MISAPLRSLNLAGVTLTILGIMVASLRLTCILIHKWFNSNTLWVGKNKPPFPLPEAWRVLVYWIREPGINSIFFPIKGLSDIFAIFKGLIVEGFVVEILNRSQTNKNHCMSLFLFGQY